MGAKDIQPGECYQKFDDADRACRQCLSASRCAKATAEKSSMERHLDAVGLTGNTCVRRLIDALGNEHVVVFHPEKNRLSCLFKDGKAVCVQVLVSKKTLRVGIASHKTKGVIEAGKEFDVAEFLSKL
jgi:hypothetical protein